MVGLNSISGVFYWGSDKNLSNPDRMTHLFEWFCVSTISEAVIQVRSMTKALIAANTSQTESFGTIALPKLTFFHQLNWIQLHMIHKQCLSKITEEVNAKITEICKTLRVGGKEMELFKEMVKNFSDKLLVDVTSLTIPLYQSLRSPIEHAASNEKYTVSGYKWNTTGNAFGEVQHAVPEAWPLSVAGLALRIVLPLCDAVECLLQYNWDLQQHGISSFDTTKIDSFFMSLAQFDLLPLEHIKFVQELIMK